MGPAPATPLLLQAPVRPAPGSPAMPGALSREDGLRLTIFAHACRAAARAAALYPAGHPALADTIRRLTDAAGRVAAGGRIAVTVQPDVLLIGGCAPARADRAVREVARLLHDRLIGVLAFGADAGADDWHTLMILVARAADDPAGAGGIAAGWSATGRTAFDIRQIDYAEVLRERGGMEAAWDRVIARCLQGESAVDAAALAALLEALQHAARFGELLARLEGAADAAGVTIGTRAAALMRLLQAAMESARATGEAAVPQALQTIADATARLTPDLLLALLDERRHGRGETAVLAAAVLERVGDDTIADFVVGSVEAAHGATERLAQAFTTLVPDQERQERLLAVAHARARDTSLGAAPDFEALWSDTRRLLLSYSDTAFVSTDYARELSAARTQALDVERVADDPPERIQAWHESIATEAVRALDLRLLVDLLRLKADPVVWEGLATLAAADAGRRILLGELDEAHQLLAQIAAEPTPEGREGLGAPAATVLNELARGPLARHFALHLRTAGDAAMAPLATICRLVGPSLVAPLTEALAAEEHPRAIRRLRELLLGFGAAGRPSVEQLKGSANPALRRAAIDLLRVFGGNEALPELESMLQDPDGHVQREAVRAVIEIGSPDAYRMLEDALRGPAAAAGALVPHVIGLRDRRTIPALCAVLLRTRPAGALVPLHLDVIDALGTLGDDAGAVETLGVVLHRGDWWAPRRTARLRRAAAAALGRIGTSDARAALDAAAASRRPGVRRAAQLQRGRGASPREVTP